jgi:hypothetical protein
MEQNFVYVMELYYLFIKMSTFRTNLILSHINMNIIDLCGHHEILTLNLASEIQLLTCLRLIVTLLSHPYHEIF